MFNISEIMWSSMEKKNKVEPDKFPIVHRSDIEVFMSLPPLSLKNGPWVAGGAAIKWFMDQPIGQSDIDVFCSSAQQCTNTVNHLKKNGFRERLSTPNAITLEYSVDPTYTIQVIRKKFFTDIDALLSQFDISACAIATDGVTFYVSDKNTIPDIRNRIVRFRRYAPTSIKRYLKYSCYGFKAPPHQLQDILDSIPEDYDFISEMGDYDGAF